jgi:hypothetical protein
MPHKSESIKPYAYAFAVSHAAVQLPSAKLNEGNPAQFARCACVDFRRSSQMAVFLTPINYMGSGGNIQSRQLPMVGDMKKQSKISKIKPRKAKKKTAKKSAPPEWRVFCVRLAVDQALRNAHAASAA